MAILLFSGMVAAQKQTQTSTKKEMQPEEIINAFTAKESEFYNVWTQYYYRQLATVKVTSVRTVRRPMRP